MKNFIILLLLNLFILKAQDPYFISCLTSIPNVEACRTDVVGYFKMLEPNALFYFGPISYLRDGQDLTYNLEDFRYDVNSFDDTGGGMVLPTFILGDELLELTPLTNFETNRCKFVLYFTHMSLYCGDDPVTNDSDLPNTLVWTKNLIDRNDVNNLHKFNHNAGYALNQAVCDMSGCTTKKIPYMKLSYGASRTLSAKIIYPNGKFPIKTWEPMNDTYVFNDGLHVRRYLKSIYDVEFSSYIESDVEFNSTLENSLIIADNNNYFMNLDNENNTLEVHSVIHHEDAEINNIENVKPLNSYKIKNASKKSNMILSKHGRVLFIDKETKSVLDELGEQCITNLPQNVHKLAISETNGDIVVISDDVIWSKKPENEDVTCHFPISGQSSLKPNQKLIQYNQIPNDENEINYLLSADKNKITIKDGEVIKVINKEDFNGDFSTSSASQTFQVN